MLTHLTASELLAAISSKKVSAREALQAHLRLVADLNPRFNAVVSFDEERARAAALAADEAMARGEPLGPLHGLPMTVKDTFDTEALLTTAGLPQLARNVPSRDAVTVARLRAAGAIIFGKTSCPLASYDWQCVHPRFGRTNNPWATDRTPGGSSGGAAAALSAGFTPLELGSDVAGSIRVPAHFCGVFGLRATEGAIDEDGHARVPGLPVIVQTLLSLGPMARSVEDLRLALCVLWGPAPNRLPLLIGGSEDAPSLNGLRVGWSDTACGVAADAPTRDVLRRALGALDEAKCEVREISPRLSYEEAFDVWGRLQGFEFGAAFPAPLRNPLLRWVFRLGLVRLRFGRGILSSSLGRGLASSRRGYFQALDRRTAMMRTWDDFLASVDVYITPTTATAAFTHRRTGSEIQVDGRCLSYSEANGSFVCPSAVLGHPVVVVPAGVTEEGLPIGLQLHGRRGSDLRLLSIAERVCRVFPFERRWPT